MARSKTTSSPSRSGARQEAAESAEHTEYTALFQSNGAAFAAAMRSGEAMLHGMAEINREVMTFAADRLRKNLEVSESLLGCRDPAQAFGVQVDHAQQATQAYFEEATRLVTLAARLSEECLQPIERQARETLSQAGRAQ